MNLAQHHATDENGRPLLPTESVHALFHEIVRDPPLQAIRALTAGGYRPRGTTPRHQPSPARGTLAALLLKELLKAGTKLSFKELLALAPSRTHPPSLRQALNRLVKLNNVIAGHGTAKEGRLYWHQYVERRLELARRAGDEERQ